MQFLTVMMMMMTIMMMSSLLHSALADESLACHNDFFNTFTCVWNTSNLRPSITPETNCSLRVTVKKLNNNVNMKQRFVEGSVSNIRTATIDFNRQNGIIIPNARILQEVICDNSVNPVALIPEHKARDSVVKVLPPVEVNVDGLNVSWAFGSKKSDYANNPTYEFQYKSAEQSWAATKSVTVTETHVAISEELLVFNEQYDLRVRAKLLRPNALWSEWSEYHWTSTVGKPRPTPGAGEILVQDWSSLIYWITLTGISLAAILILVIFFKCNKIKWVQKIHSSYIPDPDKYFSGLNTNHKGDFASWLGSAYAFDSFIKVDTEFVSPVEVVKLQEAAVSRGTDRHSGAARDEWENTSKSSNFSNSTYFLSQSSSGPRDTLEPCSAHCSYGPAGGGSGPETPLQCCVEDAHGGEEKDEPFEQESQLKILEKLRQDTQSPDSGFAAGPDDSMEETDLPSPLGLNLLNHAPLGLPAPQPNKHPLLCWEQTPLVLGSNPLMPTIDFDLKLLGSCGMIEPSSGDYMPVKNVQN